jgi:hypothetical protein
MASPEPCRDVSEYGKLIDALYFLVYEGSGACKRLPQPPPEFAMDVKFLRTALRHDIDHGDAADIQKKRLRAAQTFEKYSGKKSPEECGPEEFLSTHVRILRTLLASLQVLGAPDPSAAAFAEPRSALPKRGDISA